jgi:hypothetical protein
MERLELNINGINQELSENSAFPAHQKEQKNISKSF